MNELDKVIKHITILSNEECDNIAREAVARCDEIRDGYVQKEQDEYWKFLGKATNEAEQRLIQLGELANKEAQKKLDSTRREMVDIAFNLAAKKLAAMPEKDFKKLLSRLKLKPNFTPESVVSRYKEFLLPSVESILFDS